MPVLTSGLQRTEIGVVLPMEKELTAVEPQVGSVAWSPDGSRIAYTLSGGKLGLYAVESGGGKPASLHEMGLPGGEPLSIFLAWLK